MNKILFINHSASRTGAPIMLLHFLKWLKQEKKLNFDVLSLDNGELLDDFTAICDQHFFKQKNKNPFTKVSRYLKSTKKDNLTLRLLFPKHELKNIAKNEYNLIYSNSALSVPAGCYIKSQSFDNTKLLVHIHELNMVIHQFCPELKTYQSDIDFTIAASQMVKDNLIANWNGNGDFIKVIYEHSLVPNVISKTTDCFTVGASGLVNWRKGPDFFLLVAKYVFEKIPHASIKFQWVGRISNSNRLIYESDIKRLNLIDKVEFTGAKDNPLDYFANFDIFLMTSKEDPFPLVCIEVGMMGKPIICFEGATGTEEVLRTVEDTIVPYLDIEKMGETVIKYYKNENHRLDNGNKMKQIFKKFTPENQSVKIYNIMESLTQNSH